MSDMTTPPRRPTDGDIALLQIVQQVELAARDLYAIALEGADGDAANTFAGLHAHHDMYAQSISSQIGKAAPQTRDEDLFKSLKSGFDAASAHDLENRLIVTHTDVLSRIEGTEPAALIASILVGESRHSVALAVLAGKSPVDDIDVFLTTPEADSLAVAEG